MKKEVWITAGVILIILIGSWLIFRTKGCSDDFCFEQAARNCDEAKFDLQDENGGVTYYEIQGEEDGNCLLYIKIIKMNGISEENARLFKDADMLCAIPESEFSKMTINEMIDNLDYCHGRLKEAIYEITLKNLYGLVTRDLGNVLKQINNVL